jgi:tRNA (cmo5U34)-methyltransferase
MIGPTFGGRVSTVVLNPDLLDCNWLPRRRGRGFRGRRASTRADSRILATMTHEPFSDPAAVASYATNLGRNVPGVPVLHRLTDQILSETVPAAGRVLVVGAGGGAELTYLADRHAGWTFDGVDPSGPMLALARERSGAHAARATLHEGYVDQAPSGPFDAATCLLTLHFLSREERLRTLGEIRRRLRPGSPLLTFHHSVPDGSTRLRWLERAARYASGGEGDPAQIASTAATMAANLPILPPEEDEAVLDEAGFRDVGTFYAALTLRGWVAYA